MVVETRFPCFLRLDKLDSSAEGFVKDTSGSLNSVKENLMKMTGVETEMDKAEAIMRTAAAETGRRTAEVTGSVTVLVHHF